MENEAGNNQSKKDKKSIVLSGAGHEIIRQLAKKNGMTIGEFTAAMGYYFRETGQDPREVKGQNSAAAIQALSKKVGAFIRSQETEKLQPLLDELSLIAKSLTGFLNDYARQEQIKKVLQGQLRQEEAAGSLIEQIQLLKKEIEALKTTQQRLADNIEEKQKKKGLFG